VPDQSDCSLQMGVFARSTDRRHGEPVNERCWDLVGSSRSTCSPVEKLRTVSPVRWPYWIRLCPHTPGKAETGHEGGLRVLTSLDNSR